MSLLEALSEQPRPLTVSQLASRMKAALEGHVGRVWVEGEISNFRHYGSGHWYFSLKDATSQVKCVMYRMQARLVRFKVTDGLAVRVRARVTLYEPRSDCQLLVASIEPVGVGELQYAFEQLKQRLGAEGLFDASRKRPLPILPGRIGIVTSLDGAALRDVLHVLGRRNRHISVIIAPARVQGEGAAHEISRGIKRLAAFGGVDVVIVGRGGGSLEDLWAFNEEVVARAIAKCPVPVISAVGHETDVTIADFVADVRAATPSHAAEMVAAREAQIRDSLADLRHRAHRELALRVARARNHVTALRHAPQLAAVPARLRTLAQLTDEAVDALSDAVRSSVAMRQEALRMAVVAVRDGHPGQRVVAARAALASRVSALSGETQRQAGARRAELARLKGALASLDPLEVLSRGYAVVTDEGGRVVRRMADLVTGQRFTVRLADGSFRARREDG